MTARLAMVVAAVDARATALESVGRFLDEVRGEGDLVVVDASCDGTADMIEAGFPGVRVLRRRPGRLAPELWGDGLAATDAPLVAFSNAAMVPSQGWLRALRDRLDETDAAAVGGPIEPGEGLGPTDRAVYLLRYLNYWQPGAGGRPVEPPGDNALYRRERLSGMGDLLRTGFWESEVHARLRSRGERLVSADGARVSFRGGARLAPMVGQRFRHGLRFGASRAGRMGATARTVRAVAAPAVPAVLLGRVARGLRAIDQAPGPWLAALPGLALLATAWAAGEARGTWTGPPRSTAPGVLRSGGRGRDQKPLRGAA